MHMCVSEVSQCTHMQTSKLLLLLKLRFLECGECYTPSGSVTILINLYTYFDVCLLHDIGSFMTIECLMRNSSFYGKYI
jgi:hypothetical protein